MVVGIGMPTPYLMSDPLFWRTPHGVLRTNADDLLGQILAQKDRDPVAAEMYERLRQLTGRDRTVADLGALEIQRTMESVLAKHKMSAEEIWRTTKGGSTTYVTEHGGDVAYSTPEEASRADAMNAFKAEALNPNSPSNLRVGGGPRTPMGIGPSMDSGQGGEELDESAGLDNAEVAALSRSLGIEQPQTLQPWGQDGPSALGKFDAKTHLIEYAPGQEERLGLGQNQNSPQEAQKAQKGTTFREHNRDVGEGISLTDKDLAEMEGTEGWEAWDKSLGPEERALYEKTKGALGAKAGEMRLGAEKGLSLIAGLRGEYQAAQTAESQIVAQMQALQSQAEAPEAFEGMTRAQANHAKREKARQLAALEEKRRAAESKRIEVMGKISGGANLYRQADEAARGFESQIEGYARGQVEAFRAKRKRLEEKAKYQQETQARTELTRRKASVKERLDLAEGDLKDFNEGIDVFDVLKPEEKKQREALAKKVGDLRGRYESILDEIDNFGIGKKEVSPQEAQKAQGKLAVGSTQKADKTNPEQPSLENATITGRSVPVYDSSRVPGSGVEGSEGKGSATPLLDGAPEEKRAALIAKFGSAERAEAELKRILARRMLKKEKER